MKVLSLCLGLIVLAVVQSLLHTAHSAIWRTCGLYHLETDTHTHMHAHTRLSGLATKQLSVIVAPGASRVEAQEVNVLISFAIPECCFDLSACVYDLCSSIGMVTLSLNPDVKL